MGGDLPDKLLGVREGFRRYFTSAREGLERSGLDWSVSVSVIPQPQDEAATPLPLSDTTTLELARSRARELAEQRSSTLAVDELVERVERQVRVPSLTSR